MSDEPKKIKLTGDRWTFLVLAAAALCVNTCLQGEVISKGFKESVEMQKQQNDILRQQLEQSKRQYALDSLRFFSR